MTRRGRWGLELEPGGVVIGDDGSPQAAVAVRMAAQEALLRDVLLHVVRAWSLTSAARPPEVPFGTVPSTDEYQSATLELEKRRVAELLGGCEIAPHIVAVHAPPAEALLEASETADLLVLGDRGLGGFDRLLLGSVAEQCVRHATCSVLIARTREPLSGRRV